ncbi:hypothetical protein KIPB_016095, partial [Kipferlia bialata]|eukprot:g16095.t1
MRESIYPDKARLAVSPRGDLVAVYFSDGVLFTHVTTQGVKGKCHTATIHPS